MLAPYLSVAIFALAMALAVAAWRRRRRPTRGRAPRRSIGGVGPGAAGAFYGFLNEDKRAAIEIVVEERAGYQDPETRDGDLPQFEIRGRGAKPDEPMSR